MIELTTTENEQCFFTAESVDGIVPNKWGTLIVLRSGQTFTVKEAASNVALEVKQKLKEKPSFAELMGHQA